MVAADKVKPSPDLRLRFDTLQHRKRIPRGPQCFSLLPKTLVSFGDGLKVKKVPDFAAIAAQKSASQIFFMPACLDYDNRVSGRHSCISNRGKPIMKPAVSLFASD